MTNPPTVRPVAVIDIGASSIRMAVAEINESGEIRVLESLSQAVSLGRDTFTRGSIAKDRIEECVRVLRSYRKKLLEFQVTDPDQIRVAATSAVREASNRLAFLDRVYIATGLDVDPLDEAEVTRLTYLGVQADLNTHGAFSDARTFVVEVGAGSTELLMIHQGNVASSHTYRLGSMRLRKNVESSRFAGTRLRSMMESQIGLHVSHMRQLAPRDATVEMIALGGDLRFVLRELQPDWNGKSLAQLEVRDLEEFTAAILSMDVDQLAANYHLNLPDAETAGPALLAYLQIARAFSLSSIYVSNVNLRDGLLREFAAQDSWSVEFRQQILRSAIGLGRKYQFDEDHAVHVSELCATLFRELESEHELDSWYETILCTAAMLHEIGLFISYRASHKHSLYIIRNSELFGLGRTELLLTGLVARYHRRASPQPSHEGYGTLRRERRIAVSKLAAMLRVAKALDDSRSQRIKDVQCRVAKGQFQITVTGPRDLSMEQLAMQRAGTLFEEIFGLKVLLRRE